jgi:hypothetical protein
MLYSGHFQKRIPYISQDQKIFSSRKLSEQTAELYCMGRTRPDQNEGLYGLYLTE